jgi:uncharacterized protein
MFGKSRHEDDKYAQDVGAVRRQKDEYFASSPQSPIPHEERHHGFAGLSYFPPDPAFRVRASVNPYPDQHIVQLGTTTGDIQPQVRYAELRFHLADRDLRLAGFLDPHAHRHHGAIELFVPFRDTTSGKETYGAGRYLEVEVEEQPDGSKTAVMDFNTAYNPYCAYNAAYSCPLPPAENTLPIAINAGERTYHSHE